VRGECAGITRYAPLGAAGGLRVDTRKLPLEVLVERESVRPKPAATNRLRLVAEAGQHFLRLLAGMLSSTKYREAFIARFPMLLPAAAPDFDGEARAYLQLMSGRVPDGAKLYAALRSAPLPPAPAIEDADKEAFGRVRAAFIRWYDELFSEPIGEEQAWSTQRMEYVFSIGAPTEPETVLSCEYQQGDLDWYDFDSKPDASIGAAADRQAGVNPLPITRTLIPVPATYRGMPSPRWWEFEDAAVDFGAVEAEPDDLARMLLVEFAITYGNDWFVIPLELPVGSICTINSLVVTDTFGIRTLIPSAAASTHPVASAWRMFSNGSSSQGLFLAPTLKRTMEGRPLDEVLFLRDEMANLAWGVERYAEGASGRPLNRRQDELERQRRQDAAPPSPSNDGALKWRLSTEVPGNWIPLIPVQIEAGQGAVRFRRGVTLKPDNTREPQPAMSRILHPDAGPLDIFEEEIPREGARVTRSYQYARWIGGVPLLWIGRRKSIGRGEGSSGLRFDLAE